MTPTMRHVYWSATTVEGSSEKASKIGFSFNQSDLHPHDIATVDTELEAVTEKLAELSKWIRERNPRGGQ